MSHSLHRSITSSSGSRPSEKPALWETNGIRSNWDGLRRDQDLWIPNGDCAIYLYAEGQSRRGASFQIPVQALVESRCSTLLNLASSAPEPFASPRHRSSSNLSTTSSIDETCQTAVRRIYIGVPSHLSKEDAFNWHLTTRNFFAWLLHKPLVGTNLSRALIDLFGRMSIYRESSVDNVADILEFADSLGYSDFSNKPELALAMLSFADEFKLEETWIDAFVHCVGMNEKLAECREFETTRSVNKALIKRAALQMDLRLEKLTKSIRSFLVEELSEPHIQLSAGSRRHLDQFRSFLKDHFKSSNGVWPPAEDQYSKPVYDGILQEFDCLYSYLANMNDETSRKGDAASEISVDAILNLFNEQNGLDPLPYTHPLIPDINEGAGFRTQAHWALQRKSGTKGKLSPADLVKAANLSAANHEDPLVLESNLVKAYKTFEANLSKSFDDQLSFADARKVRWILIYALVSYLVATNKAPPQVRDQESTSYPLCCSVAGVPTWSLNTSSRNHSRSSSQHNPQDSNKTELPDAKSRPTNNDDSSRFPPVDEEDVFSDNYVFTNGSSAYSELPPQPPIPRKSIRRSLIIPNSFDYNDFAHETDSPSSYLPEESDLSVHPLRIPDRTASSHSIPQLHQRSLEESTDRPISADSDSAPSLNWSSGTSPSLTNDSGSDQDDSSSTYSLRPESPPKSLSGTGKSPENVFWSHEGEFICPGISA